MTKTILVVEDSPEDFEATRRALSKAGLQTELTHCADADEAFDLLQPRNTDAHCGDEICQPDLILLDLNLPGTDGLEVLLELKGDPDLKGIPVIVLTTSSDERDIADCYAAGANAYVQKPVNIEQFQRAIQRLYDFWLEATILPSRRAV